MLTDENIIYLKWYSNGFSLIWRDDRYFQDVCHLFQRGAFATKWRRFFWSHSLSFEENDVHESFKKNPKMHVLVEEVYTQANGRTSIKKTSYIDYFYFSFCLFALFIDSILLSYFLIFFVLFLFCFHLFSQLFSFFLFALL